jgi:hypothetical protein
MSALQHKAESDPDQFEQEMKKAAVQEVSQDFYSPDMATDASIC